MNQTCKVCGEPAAGFHFGAFTCEGCKSFFGRSYNNLSSISECKNNGKCTIDKKNRTTCKACRLRKCYNVGMSKGGSRYGRRSNWFKIHCLLQEQQQQALEAASINITVPGVTPNNAGSFGDLAAAMAAQQHVATHMPAPPSTYASYLPDMSAATGPFLTTNALPFFNIMNPLPGMANRSSPSAFQVPPQLLFRNYHQATSYRSEIYDKQRPTAESTTYPPHIYHNNNNYINDCQQMHRVGGSISSNSRESPELCVEESEELTSLAKTTNTEEFPTTVHSPIAIRISPEQIVPENHYEKPAITSNETSCSVSPVSVGAETVSSQPIKEEIALNQDSPIDLSMKTSRSSIHSETTTTTASDLLSEASEEERSLNHRRSFYALNTDSEMSESSLDSVNTKRSKVDASNSLNSTYNSHNANAVRSIFVCV